jgi:hypothetical protein
VERAVELLADGVAHERPNDAEPRGGRDLLDRPADAVERLAGRDRVDAARQALARHVHEPA